MKNKDDLSKQNVEKTYESKDEIINEKKKMGDGVELFPFDEASLKTFNLKEMNFKDMTNAQKSTMFVIVLVIILLILLLFMPMIMRVFGNTNIGNLRFLPQQKEEKEEESSYAFAGDYIIIGNNTSLVVQNVKFNNFTKSSDYKGLYNYTALEDIKDVNSLNIYVEYYNYSKTLLRRFAFTVDGNKLSKGSVGLSENKMSENAFNKAYYVRVRVISESEIIDFPDPEDPNDPNNQDYDPDDLTDPRNPNSPNYDPNYQGGGNSGDPSDPSGNNGEDSKSGTVICNRLNVDKDLRVTEQISAEFTSDKLDEYTVKYKITSVSENGSSANYAKYYKAMMKKYRSLDSSGVSQIQIGESLDYALLTYTVDLDEYFNFQLKDNSIRDNIEIMKQIYEEVQKDKDYKLEIDAVATKQEAKDQLTEEKWVCD